MGSTEMKMTWDELISAPIPKTILNEPIDFNVNFAAEEPKRESATERARKRWFERDRTAATAEGG